MRSRVAVLTDWPEQTVVLVFPPTIWKQTSWQKRQKWKTCLDRDESLLVLQKTGWVSQKCMWHMTRHSVWQPKRKTERETCQGGARRLGESEEHEWRSFGKEFCGNFKTPLKMNICMSSHCSFLIEILSYTHSFKQNVGITRTSGKDSREDEEAWNVF